MEPRTTHTMDAAGRVVIPAVVRRQLALVGGAALTIAVEAGAIRLSPVEGAGLARRARRLVVRAPSEGELPDHRDLREERGATLSP